jgi:hypothetical protein
MMASWTAYLCAGLAGFFAGVALAALGLLILDFWLSSPRSRRNPPSPEEPLTPFSDPVDYDPIRILGVDHSPYDWAQEEHQPERASRGRHPTRLVDMPEMTDGSFSDGGSV